MVRITDEVAAIVRASGVQEGLALVSAMHITAGVYVNDWEDGLIEDIGEWLERLAPARPEYRHHRTGEDNADAHLKRTIMGHQWCCRSRRGSWTSAVGAGLLRGVRRPAPQARRRQGHGGVAGSNGPAGSCRSTSPLPEPKPPCLGAMGLAPRSLRASRLPGKRSPGRAGFRIHQRAGA